MFITHLKGSILGIRHVPYRIIRISIAVGVDRYLARYTCNKETKTRDCDIDLSSKIISQHTSQLNGFILTQQILYDIL